VTHAVHFYDDDDVLLERVTDFVAEGLRDGIPAIVIATEPHRAALRQRLGDRRVDVAAARGAGMLTVLDARQTLVQICDDDGVAPSRFASVVGRTIDEVLRVTGATQIRAFGEMVDLLWRDGRTRDALALELLWNETISNRAITLLCSYHVSSFAERRDVDAVCRVHDEVHPMTRPVRALAAELAHREIIEKALRDTTARLRRAEAEARRHRDELQSFLDTAAIPIHVVDTAGTITWANRAALELLGHERIGRHVSTLYADVEIAADIVARMASGAPIDDREVRLIARDGSIRHVALGTSVQVDDNGKPVATRCFSRDITDRKRAELDREASIAELTRTVRLNETLAGVVAHDLRNPLNTIIMGGEMVLGHVDDPAITKPLRRVLGSAHRMQRMIEQLLDLSRVRSGTGIPLERADCSLAGIVRDVIEEIRVVHPTREVRLEVAGDTIGEWDAGRLAQVFSNLIGNAIEHGDAAAPISVAIAEHGDQLQVEVSNTGTIPDHIVPVLFAPFRGSQRRGPKSQGLGLGLYITFQIVRAHGGTIDVSSNDGTTRFVIRMPRGAPSPSATAFGAASDPVDPVFPPRRADVAEAEVESFHMLVDCIRDAALFMLDPRGYVVSWNAGARLIKGYTRDEIIGRHFSTFYPRDDVRAGRCDRELEIAERDGELEDTGWRVRKDGSLFWARVVITAMRDRDGRLVGFAKMTRDLTSEHHAAEVARQSDERFRLLVDGVQEYAIFMLDPEGHVATWNAGAQRIKGYRADEIIGRHFSTFYTSQDVGTNKAERELEIAIRDGRFEEEGWRVRKDGSAFWANVVLTAIRDHTGELVGFTKVTRDLTDRRRHEEQRLRLVQANEAVRLRDEFLSVVSHELKTPLTVMRLQIESLAEVISDSADTTTTSKVERTLRANQRLDRLVETLLDVSRITSGRFELRFEDCDLGHVVRDAVSMMNDAAVSAGCRLQLQITESIAGRWDRDRIGQMVTNLIANAMKYAAGSAVDILVAREDRDAIIQVRDHGPGLPGDADHLFERFERAASGKHHGGLGLGLYVVRQIAEAHAGSAIASNASDGGACFRIRLPIVQTPTVMSPNA
jgi:PAS domain S-box-containing protein